MVEKSSCRRRLVAGKYVVHQQQPVVLAGLSIFGHDRGNLLESIPSNLRIV